MGLFSRKKKEHTFDDTEMKSELDARLHLQNIDLGLLGLHCKANKGTRSRRIVTHTHELTIQFKDNYFIVGDIKPINGSAY